MAIGLLSLLKKTPDSEVWCLPLSFARDGITMVSLREALNCKSNVVPIVALTSEQLRALVITRMRKRITEQIRFEYAGPHGHVRSPSEALCEIEMGSQLGHELAALDVKLLERLSHEVHTLGD